MLRGKTMAAKKEEKPAEYMTYPEYLENIKKGIVTEDGHCPVTPLLIMLPLFFLSALFNSHL